MARNEKYIGELDEIILFTLMRSGERLFSTTVWAYVVDILIADIEREASCEDENTDLTVVDDVLNATSE